jgi:DNA polymerase-3 subunit epsilon
MPPRGRAAKSPRALLACIFGALAAAVVLVAIAGIALVGASGPEFARQASLWSAAAAVLLGALAAAWLVVQRRWLRPLALAGRDLEVLLHARAPPARLSLAHFGRAGMAIEALAARFVALRRETDDAIASAAAEMAEQKLRLEAVLLGLSEGVIVCSPEHKIILYNRTAVRLIGAEERIGLGRSLIEIVGKEPVLHTLELLTGGGDRGQVEVLRDRSTTLVLSAADGSRLLHARLSLLPGQHGSPGGYVLTLADVDTDLAELAKREALLRAATEGLRGPVANIRATAEAIKALPAPDDPARPMFETNLLTEATRLADTLEKLAAESRNLGSARWPRDDVNAADLVRCAAQHLRDRLGIALTLTGLPLWLRIDSHPILAAIEVLAEKIAQRSGVREIDVETLLADRHIYLELRWAGEAVPSSELDRWLETPLPRTPGDATLKAVLDRHDSEAWSFARGPGIAVLRFPLPPPRQPQFRARPTLPPRPEFYDFDLFSRTATAANLDRSLAEVDYVVFDTETTGLRAEEDEIVALGAVRIVNRRLITGETFERVVDPGRPIPPLSTKYHGITDAMVAGRPPIAVVLPQFHAFAHNAVLVAHNAAFDMAFLTKHEGTVGVRFDNPVLDTLLLAGSTLDHLPEHSLDALAQRFAVPITQRHSALADAMATAMVFLRLLELLDARGIATLREALAASGRTAELRQLRARA